MDDVSFFAAAGTGEFTVTVAADKGKIGGAFKLNYTVSGGGGGGSAAGEVRVQASDLSKTDNTYSDTDLTVDLTPGTYQIQLMVRELTNAVPDSTLELSYSGTVTLYGAMAQAYNSGGTITDEASTTLPHEIRRTSSTQGGTWMDALLVVSTSGTLKVRWAQVITSAPNPVILYAGSWMIVTKLA
jgi:hypothetical protein